MPCPCCRSPDRFVHLVNGAPVYVCASCSAEWREPAGPEGVPLMYASEAPALDLDRATLAPSGWEVVN